MREKEAVTKARLLEAAEKLFARKGFSAASVREITQLARCNVAAINYHFGSKQKLYQSVFEERFKQLTSHRLERLDHALKLNPSVESLVEAFARGLLEPLLSSESNADFVELIAREMVESILPKKLFLEQVIKPVQSRFAKALVSILPELSEGLAAHIAFLIAGQVIHLIHRSKFEGARLTPSMLEEEIRLITVFSTGGIKALASANQAGRL